MFDVLLAVLMGEFVFHVPLRGNVALLFGMAAIFLIGALSMGMLISIVTKSQLLASQLAMVATFLPAFLLSGFMFTIANMPAVDPDRHLPRAGAVLRGDPQGHLPEGRGLEILWPATRCFADRLRQLVVLRAGRSGEFKKETRR